MSVHALIARMEAAGYRLLLKQDGGVRVEPAPPAEVVAQLRSHKAELAAALVDRDKGQEPPGAAATEAAGELAACDREAEILRRIETGLGPEVDAGLWRVVDRLLAVRDLETAQALWSRVVTALDRGILSRLVGWVRSLDGAGRDLGRIRALISDGPGRHKYHDGGGGRLT